MRKPGHLLASLVFLGWTTVASAAPMKEMVFYFPGDGQTVDRFGRNIPPVSLLPSVTVTFPTTSGLCISPCWDTSVRPSASVGATGADSQTADRQRNSSSENNGSTAFDPLVIAGIQRGEGSGAGQGQSGMQGRGQGRGQGLGLGLGQGRGPDLGLGQGQGPDLGLGQEQGAGTGPGDGIHNVQFCTPDTQNCTEGTAINRTVPLPSTLLLFGLGLFGLARFSRSKR